MHMRRFRPRSSQPPSLVSLPTALQESRGGARHAAMEEGASIELRLVFRAVVISDSELVVQFLRRSGACASSQMCSCKNLTYTYLATFKLPTMGPQHMPSLARCFDGEFLENVPAFFCFRQLQSAHKILHGGDGGCVSSGYGSFPHSSIWLQNETTLNCEVTCVIISSRAAPY